jgi:filamentous hemagglutinin family protein
MNTSLISSAATSQQIKADRPQQLQSVTVYFRGRKMVLMQRPQRRLSLLLCHMLRRSMLNLLGRLRVKLAAPVKKALSAGALCAMALASATTAHAAATVDTLPVNTLPTNPVVTYGTAGINTTGNQMNVDIGTNKAIINWGSFSIGSQAGVDFHFDNATSTSSVLNRVIGNDPSKIMGSLTSNGKVFLINSAGILVGKTAKIDVAGFVASTLNITNSDFLAGKMSFHDQHRHHRPAGDVVVEEDGSIKTKEGGSVYLIGANVENGGVITSPKGEVLLAAGHSVDLVDTGTPGVKINVKGDKGKITNLGKIMVDTGIIGFGAALIDNRGMLNASSVDKAGGRIFLRASKDLVTTETSTINADGTTGGDVVLYADGSAAIDGDVSALGNVDGKGGKGGYVDTSGKKMLNVKYAPRIGAGGTWYIDPANISILSTCDLICQLNNFLGGILSGTDGNTSSILASSIQDTLNLGTNVTIATGATGSTGTGNNVGNITIDNGVTIAKDNTHGPATLILNAANNITIGDNVSITDSSTAGKGLGLVMVAGYTGAAVPNHLGAISSSNSTISVHNGFEAHAATYDMKFDSLTASGGFVMDATLTANSSSSVTINNTVSPAVAIGDMTLKGGSTLNFNNSTGTIGTVTLAGSGSALTATNSSVTLGATTVTGAALTFDNSTATVGATSLDATSSLTVKNASHVTASGAITGTGTLNLGANSSDASSLAAGSHAVTVNALHQKSGTLSGTDTLAVNTVVDQTGGSISFQNVNLTQNSGTLTVGNVTATGTLNLTATNGAIAQLASSSLAAAVLNATATSGIALNNTANAAAKFAATNSTSGTIGYMGTGNLSLGVIDNGTRSVSITTGSGSVTQLGAMTAGDVSVSATSGIDFTNPASQIASFSASNSTSGDIGFSTTGNVILETVTNSAAGGNITATAGGQLGVNGAVSALNQVSLTSTTSNITQANGLGSVTAASLVTEAKNGIVLGSSLNSVGSFSATNHSSGMIYLNNHGGTAGAMTLGNVNQLATTGTTDVTIGNNGAITATGAVAGATNGAVSIESTTGNLQLAGVTGGAVTLTADSGSISQTGALVATGAVVVVADSGIALGNSSNEFGTLTATNNGTGDISVTTHGGQHLALNGVSTTNGNIAVTNTNNSIDLSGNVTTGNAANTVSLTAGAGIVQNAGVITTNQLSAHAANDLDLGSTGNSVRNFSASSDGGHISLANTGTLATFGSTTASASKYITLSTTGNLTVGGQVNAGTIGLTSGGDIAVNSTVGASGSAVTLHADGAITQTAAVIGDSLNATAGTGITLNHLSNAVNTFSATNSNTGNIAFTNSKSLALGSINNSSHGVTINTKGALSSTGSIAASTLDVTAEDAITLNNAGNHVDTFSAASTNGDIAFTDSRPLLTLGTINNGTHNVKIVTDGNLLQNSGITTGTLDVTANGGINLNSTNNHVSNFTASNPVGNIDFVDNGNLTTSGHISALSGDVNLSTTGNLVVGGQGIEAATVHLASGGAISQSGLGASINTSSLDATTSGNGNITLDNSSNSIDAFTASAVGNVTLNTADALSLGNVSANDVTVTSQNGLTMNGNIVTNDGVVTLTSTLGNVALRNITAETLTVKANQGSISQAWPTILTVSGELHAEAKSGITLDTNVSNQVGQFSALNSDSGDITFVNHSGVGNVLTLGKIDNAHGNVKISNNLGVEQARGVNTGISTMALNVTAAGGITMDASTNNVGAFTALNATSGDIALTNTATTLSLNGTVRNNAAGGNITIVNTGDITGVATHSMSDGSVTNGIFATTGKVTLTAKELNGAGGNVKLAQISATDLEVNADKAITQEGTNAVIVNVTGTMTANAKTGITLDGNSNVTFLNHIANFDATNTDSGNITVYNQSTGADVNNIVKITNNGGNILVDNTGAMKTTGLVSAPHGSVALATHSPLTIGTGGINASTGVNLTAGNGQGVTDTVVVNGAITNITGAPLITGTHVTMNAPVFGPAPVYAGANPPDFGSGYALNPVSVTTPPTTPPVVVPPSSTIDQNVASTTNAVNNTTDATAVVTTNQLNTPNSASNQTAGGGDGEFGGSKDDGKAKDKSNKPAPICT